MNRGRKNQRGSTPGGEEEDMSDAVKDMIYYFENREIVSDKYFLIMVSACAIQKMLLSVVISHACSSTTEWAFHDLSFRGDTTCNHNVFEQKTP